MQRYIHLKKLRDIVSMYRYQGNEVYIEPEILELCIKSCGIIEETNNIYLLMYVGSIEIIKKILGSEYIKSLDNDFEDNNSIAVYYIDIENPKNKIIIPIEYQKDRISKRI